MRSGGKNGKSYNNNIPESLLVYPTYDPYDSGYHSWYHYYGLVNLPSDVVESDVDGGIRHAGPLNFDNQQQTISSTGRFDQVEASFNSRSARTKCCKEMTLSKRYLIIIICICLMLIAAGIVTIVFMGTAKSSQSCTENAENSGKKGSEVKLSLPSGSLSEMRSSTTAATTTTAATITTTTTAATITTTAATRATTTAVKFSTTEAVEKSSSHSSPIFDVASPESEEFITTVSTSSAKDASTVKPTIKSPQTKELPSTLKVLTAAETPTRDLPTTNVPPPATIVPKTKLSSTTEPSITSDPSTTTEPLLIRQKISQSPTPVPSTTKPLPTESPTQPPNTERPTTQQSTTKLPTTEPPTTKSSITQSPATESPTIQRLPTRDALTIKSPTTATPPTTTQPQTTTEPPTTQPPPTPERLTTQSLTKTKPQTTQITTTEPRTTQPSPTTEPSTTQPTTTEPSTTQPPTTTEPSKTQPPPTAEPPPTTTAEPPTTQPPTTTAEPPTTQLSSTTEPPTTQLSSTTEPLTTELPTTEPPTTQPPTTESASTKEPLTVEPPETTKEQLNTSTLPPITDTPTLPAPLSEGPSLTARRTPSFHAVTNEKTRDTTTSPETTVTPLDFTFMTATVSEFSIYLPAELTCTFKATLWQEVTINTNTLQGLSTIASFSSDGSQTLFSSTRMYNISRLQPEPGINVFILKFMQVTCVENATYVCRGRSSGVDYDDTVKPIFGMSAAFSRAQISVPEIITAGVQVKLLCQSLEFRGQAVILEYSRSEGAFSDENFGESTFFSENVNGTGLECVYLSRSLRQFAFSIEANGDKVRCMSLSSRTTSIAKTLNVVQPQ